MKIHQMIFSPTGGTRRVSEIVCQGMGQETLVTDLCVKAADIQLPNIHEEDLAVIAMPVFAGRVPALALERLQKKGGSVPQPKGRRGLPYRGKKHRSGDEFPGYTRAEESMCHKERKRVVCTPKMTSS